ncbi:MAG TPA: glycosyltransferase family 39 protein [Bryobacteraceae bacterium]|jgi:4-amino-4-deoxy-L-arabinose transferase-like glycosyltransferase|nr:glycosyltransferase family 39 protein [Bryobacteraceae bacterium]
MKRRLWWLAVLILALLRLCHVGLLWADEDYHIAAALQLLHGKLPYRDFWYDKPPFNAVFYLLAGALPGWPLRLLDAAYVLLACWLVYRLARAWWGEREGRIAALLLAFYLAFYLPSAVIAFAADALMLAPHVAAVYCAYRKRAFAAGVWCGVAFLFNAKAVFVAAVCGLWLLDALLPLVAGFACATVAAALAAWATGTLDGYWQQVWQWGWIYAAGSPVVHPLTLGAVRTLDWLGFHAALALGTIFTFRYSQRPDRWRLGSWLLLSFAAVCVGTRFAPHYYLQLLPVLVVAGARGLLLACERYRRLAIAVICVALAVPLVRFGPRYAMLAWDLSTGKPVAWRDATLDVDSQAAARLIRSEARPGDTLFVWGYRPDVYVFTRLTSDGKFWDSQPVTGVPADRHLHASGPIYAGPAAQNRTDFVKTKPIWFVDGLGLMNPHLAPVVFPEVREFLKNYREAGRTKLSIVYRRINP